VQYRLEWLMRLLRAGRVSEPGADALLWQNGRSMNINAPTSYRGTVFIIRSVDFSLMTI
jgi:hypothetical protein